MSHPNPYTAKNILVTGGCGFIGSNYILNCLSLGKADHVVNLDCVNYCSTVSLCHSKSAPVDLAAPPHGYTFIKGSTTSYELVSHILKEYNIDTVINFAAQSHVDNSFSESLEYTNDNIVGTHTLLEACRHLGPNSSIQRIIHVSTDEVYGESCHTDTIDKKKTEHSILCPTNPYSATKAGAELIAMSYYYSYGMPIIITRGNNVYGPRQYPEKLIPKFISLMKQNKPLTIHGDGNSVRSFIFVDDVVSAFNCIMKFGVDGEIYNIGANDEDEYSVNEVADKLTNLYLATPPRGPGKSKIERVNVQDRNFNDKRYYISNKKLIDMGWEPKVKFDEGLKLTMDWYFDDSNTTGCWSNITSIKGSHC